MQRLRTTPVGPFISSSQPSACGCLRPFLRVMLGVPRRWTSPTGQESARIDYVGVPVTWVADGLQTEVWEDFEGLQARDDHWPATLRATLCRRARGDAHGVYRRMAVRPNGLPSDHYVPRMESLLQSPALGWNVGVDEHFGSLVQGWRRVGQLECATPVTQPQQSYLRQATFQLISWRKAWRAHLRQVLTYARNRRLAFGLTVWRWANRRTTFTVA